MVLGMNALPELLTERREEAGLSQRAVARELGVSPQTYVWWERGAVTPKATAAGELAQWLGLSKGDILVALGILEPGETIVKRENERIS
ncbi:MAG: helix-turn-helix protein [Actinomycetota bacterium]|jgi:transcriptional regulator with XRE-family HTH domain|nr:helix-turn-helix protein [Actinomycetota bacterium]